MTLGLTGSRTWENKLKIKNFIFKLKDQTKEDIVIVGLGDKDGADKYIKRYALEMGYTYREMNPAHTPKNLYSVMAEAYYNKAYQPKNLFQQSKIFSDIVDSCVIFDNTNVQDKKIINTIKQLNKAKKKAIIIIP